MEGLSRLRWNVTFSRRVAGGGDGEALYYLASMGYAAEQGTIFQGTTNCVVLPRPSRRLAPVLKFADGPSFQRYIVRDISLTEIYRWLMKSYPPF